MTARPRGGQRAGRPTSYPLTAAYPRGVEDAAPYRDGPQPKRHFRVFFFQIQYSPSSTSVSRYTISVAHAVRTLSGSVPVATTGASGAPSAARICATMPSSMAAVPYTMPLCRQSAVLAPSKRRGRASSSTWGSCAVLRTSADSEHCGPGRMLPPTSAELDLDGAQKVLKLIDMLEDLDDVQDVYHNAEIADELLALTSKARQILEIEVGAVGGEEDGQRAEINEKLYSTPADGVTVAQRLGLGENGRYMAAFTFGNVHGAYKPGVVKLRPELLGDIQNEVAAAVADGRIAGHAAGRGFAGEVPENKPFPLVFHGGSGSSAEEIAEAVSHGVVKMNIDTDTQYAFTRAIAGHMFAHYDGVLKIDGKANYVTMGISR